MLKPHLLSQNGRFKRSKCHLLKTLLRLKKDTEPWCSFLSGLGTSSTKRRPCFCEELPFRLYLQFTDTSLLNTATCFTLYRKLIFISPFISLHIFLTQKSSRPQPPTLAASPSQVFGLRLSAWHSAKQLPIFS